MPMHDLDLQILISAVCIGFAIIWFYSRYLPLEQHDNPEE